MIPGSVSRGGSRQRHNPWMTTAARPRCLRFTGYTNLGYSVCMMHGKGESPTGVFSNRTGFLRGISTQELLAERTASISFAKHRLALVRCYQQSRDTGMVLLPSMTYGFAGHSCRLTRNQGLSVFGRTPSVTSRAANQTCQARISSHCQSHSGCTTTSTTYTPWLCACSGWGVCWVSQREREREPSNYYARCI